MKTRIEPLSMGSPGDEHRNVGYDYQAHVPSVRCRSFTRIVIYTSNFLISLSFSYAINQRTSLFILWSLETFFSGSPARDKSLFFSINKAGENSLKARNHAGSSSVFFFFFISIWIISMYLKLFCLVETYIYIYMFVDIFNTVLIMYSDTVPYYNRKYEINSWKNLI